MQPRVQPKRLLVEGDTDKRVIPFLMEANGVAWGTADRPAVYIAPYGGVGEMLKAGAIEGELSASGLEALGIVADANGDARKRWAQIRRLCQAQVPSLPEDLPAEGLRVTHASGPRFGVWIMPDNRSKGMLEDLLVQLVPSESESLFALARRCIGEAADIDAPFKPAQLTKARVHTWLAWQDEPGKSLHQAVHHRVLDPTKAESKPFVRWFRSLFTV